MNPPKTIGPMTKVGLEIAIEPPPGNPAETVSRVSFDFIFGIGVDGLSGLEMHLSGRKAGETIMVEVEPGAMDELMGHLGCNLMKTIAQRPPFVIKILVKSVTPAEPREVVRAMAANTECGCDCGCGCF